MNQRSTNYIDSIKLFPRYYKTSIIIRGDTGEPAGRTFRIPRERSLVSNLALLCKDVIRNNSIRKKFRIATSKDLN